MNYKRLTKQLILYLIGFFILALGVTVSVKGNLGVSSVNAIPYAMSLVLGIKMGNCTTIFFCFLVLLQALILRRKFSFAALLQVPASFVFGWFVNIAQAMLAPLQTPENYFLRLLFVLVSIVLIAAGIFLYLTADLLSLPAEGLSLAICQVTGAGLPKVKRLVDCSFVITAALITIIFLGRLDAVREGTILAALTISTVLGIFLRRFSAPLNAWLGEKSAVSADNK